MKSTFSDRNFVRSNGNFHLSKLHELLYTCNHSITTLTGDWFILMWYNITLITMKTHKTHH